jgi:sulfur dioxygenase
VHKLFTLPEQTWFFPAHDYRGNLCSSIGEEKLSNPRIAGRSRDAYIALMANLGMPLPENIRESLQANESAIDDDSIKFPSLAQLASVQYVTPGDLYAQLIAPIPPVLLDMREPDEFAGELGHIAGSILIPLRHLSRRVNEVEKFKGREIVAICRAGARSTTTAALLRELGFEHVRNLRGGILDWIEAELPVERASV